MIKKNLRVFIMFVLVFGIAMLAKKQVAWAGGPVVRNAFQSDLAQLEGYVWNDSDWDGIHDADEAGVANVTVNLYNSSNALVTSSITDGDGLYLFNDLPLGDYYVEFVLSAGYEISPQDQGDDEALDSDVYITTGKTSVTPLVAGKNNMKWDLGLYQIVPYLGETGPGSVKPPPPVVKTCENSVFSVGGVATLEIKDLKPSYCVEAHLWNPADGLGSIPEDAGKALARKGFIRIYQYGSLIYELPTLDGTLETCFAIPPQKQAQIYFFDFYGPRFEKRSGPPTWEKVNTTIENGIACAFSQKSGAYALIGK